MSKAHKAHGSLGCGWEGFFSDSAATDKVLDSLFGVIAHNEAISGTVGVDIGNFR